jgi:hypothetical protein
MPHCKHLHFICMKLESSTQVIDQVLYTTQVIDQVQNYSRRSQEETGGPGGPGGARRSQEEPGGARRRKEGPGGAGRSQEEPGGANRGQEEPGGANKLEPGKARGSPPEPQGARRDREDPGGPGRGPGRPGRHLRLRCISQGSCSGVGGGGQIDSWRTMKERFETAVGVGNGVEVN